MRTVDSNRVEVVGVMPRPTRETVVFLVVLTTIAIFGGITAAAVVSADTGSSTAMPATDAPETDVLDADQHGETDADQHGETDTDPNASIDYAGERLVVDPASDQEITGETTLDRGEQVTVRVRSSNSQQPFLRSVVANVTATGTFDVNVDFDGIERGTEFTVSVRYNGSVLAEAPGVVGGCDPVCDGDLTLQKQVFSGTAGDTVAVGVSLSGVDQATVAFGSEETNVMIPVTVTDGNDDGVVVVQFDTGTDDPTSAGVQAKAAGDEVTVHESIDRPSDLSPGEYPVALYAPGEYDEGEEVDVGTVVLREPTEDPESERDDGTTVGTIYNSETDEVGGADDGVSATTIGLLGAGGILAILGVFALAGGLN